MKGRIIRGVGGFYYVKTEKGVYQCRARGVFKKKGLTPTVGDEVLMEITHEGDMEGFVTEIFPRKNVFIRPPISNVDTILVVVAAKDPDPNWYLIDKFLVTAEMSDVDIRLCVNKTDLADEPVKADFRRIYGNLYPLHFLSCETGEGVAELKEAIAGTRTALAGPSGVGKSTLLNLLHEEAEQETGGISRKTGRGRHTTRHVEIFPMDAGGYVYDTPGFTSLDPPEMEEADLASCYPEMRPYLGQCRFDNCRHLKEPDCRVREALAEGKIAEERYKSYGMQIEELRAKDPYA